MKRFIVFPVIISLVSFLFSCNYGNRDRAEEFPLIKGGVFLMGSPETEKGRDPGETLHEITVKDFYIKAHEITFSEFDAFCLAEGRSLPNDEGWGRGDLPVIWVTWHDAVEYCNWLSRQEDLEQVYEISGSRVEWNQSANGYRLPTEAEWEYACRAGSVKAFAFGGKLSVKQANFGRRTGKSVPVGSYKANRFGLYDMHGNVYEWCWDTYADYGSDKTTIHRVLRGGSCYSSDSLCRSAARSRVNPIYGNNACGFRVARNAP